MKCSIKFDLSLTWFDSRLNWMDLLDNKWLNYLYKEDIEKIWMPKLVFRNTADEMRTDADNKSFILVEKLGEYKRDILDLHETAYYEGSENPISRRHDMFVLW